MDNLNITTKKDYNILTEWQKEHILATYKAIINGDIIADIVHISSSGMSRRIKFYYIQNNKIERATDAINYLLNKGLDYNLIDKGLMVKGGGMDMILHTLYKCLPYEIAQNWNQNYQIL